MTRRPQATTKRDIFESDVEQAINALLTNRAGRSFLYWVYSDLCERKDGVVKQTIGGPDAAPLETFRAIGKLAVGDALADKCKAQNFEGWLDMLRENEAPTRGAEAEPAANPLDA